jgi:hypothetical protein
MKFSVSRSIVLVSLLTGGVAGCQRQQPLAPVDGPLAVVVGSPGTSYRTDPATILGARIEGDLLNLDVEFGGGCSEHEFALVHSGGFRESFPVQTDLRLMHDANGDPCRALVQRMLVFDLTPLKQVYLTSYAAPSGEMEIHVIAPGPQAANLSIRYRF